MIIRHGLIIEDAALNSETGTEKNVKKPGNTTITCGLTDAFLALLKIFTGVFTGYLPMMAGGFHSLCDVIVDVSAWVTLSMSARDSDQRFHYGRRRVGTIVALFAAALMVFVSLQLVVEVFTQSYSESDWNLVMPALIGAVAALAVVFKELLFRMVRRHGLALNSLTLVNNAWHHRVDMSGSLIILLSLIFHYAAPQFVMLEAVATMLIVGLILHTAWSVGSNAIKELIDFVPSLETQGIVDELTESFEEITFIQSTRIRAMGGALYVELVVEVEPTLTVDDLYDVTQQIREKLMDNVPNILDVIIMPMPKGDYVQRVIRSD